MNKLQKGYTLIEFLIILSIVLILLAIFIPAFKRYNNPGYFILTCDGITIDHKINIKNRLDYDDSTTFRLEDNSEYKCYKYSLERIK